MSQFKKNLGGLPSITHLTSLDVVLPDMAEVVVSIENKPGKSGSLAVYAYLNAEYGAMTKEAALRGLALFGEHTEDAKQNPGSHPNIDFLFKVIAADLVYQIKTVEKKT